MYARMSTSGVLDLRLHARTHKVPAMSKRITLKDDVLYAICSREDISRDELSRRLRVSTNTAYRIDSGRVDPSPAFIAALIDYTGKPFDDLFDIVNADATKGAVA